MTPKICLAFGWLAFGALAPLSADGQSRFFVRLSPEANRMTIEHTKTVSIGGGSSTSVSESSGVDIAASLAGGFRAGPSVGWMYGGEMELVISSRRLIEGIIQPTPNGNPHDVWPGRWEFTDRYSLGASLQLGRGIGDGGAQAYVLVGTRRMSSEFVTGGTNPANGDAGEDRSRLAHWPAIAGVGLTLRQGWPVDLRLRYFKSLTGWVVSAPDIRLDYDYAVSGLSFSVGIGAG